MANAVLETLRNIGGMRPAFTRTRYEEDMTQQQETPVSGMEGTAGFRNIDPTPIEPTQVRAPLSSVPRYTATPATTAAPARPAPAPRPQTVDTLLSDISAGRARTLPQGVTGFMQVVGDTADDNFRPSPTRGAVFTDREGGGFYTGSRFGNMPLAAGGGSTRLSDIAALPQRQLVEQPVATSSGYTPSFGSGIGGLFAAAALERGRNFNQAIRARQAAEAEKMGMKRRELDIDELYKRGSLEVTGMKALADIEKARRGEAPKAMTQKDFNSAVAENAKTLMTANPALKFEDAMKQATAMTNQSLSYARQQVEAEQLAKDPVALAAARKAEVQNLTRDKGQLAKQAQVAKTPAERDALINKMNMLQDQINKLSKG